MSAIKAGDLVVLDVAARPWPDPGEARPFDLFNRCAAEADRRITEAPLGPPQEAQPRLGYAAALAHLHVVRQQAIARWDEFLRLHALPAPRKRRRVRRPQWRVKLRRAGAKRRAR